MDRSLRLGTVAGVRVHAHWSLLVIALLLAASLARAFRPEVGGAAAAWFGGLLAAVLFFASILAHELAHAAAARRAGVRVERVTLWLFGGMAHLDDAAPTPGSQLRIALAGPLASVAVGAGALGSAFAANTVGFPRVVVVVVAWLAVVNGVVCVFNLLPGSPLDGGRVLAAVVWRRTGSRGRGERAAGRAGIGVGSLLVVAGLLNAAFGVGAPALWGVLVGIFVVSVARIELDFARELDAAETGPPAEPVGARD